MKEKRVFGCRSTEKRKFCYAKKLTLEKEKKAPSVANMKATVSPAYDSDSNGVGAAMSRFNDFMDVESDIHGFKSSSANMMGMGIEKISITEANLP